MVKHYAVFFDYVSTDFEAIFDLTDCQVSPVQHREFAVQGVRLLNSHLIRAETEAEAHVWHAQFMRAAHYREDRAHERRLVERRRRLERERQQRMERAAEQGESGEPAVAFDYEARMAQLLAELPTGVDGSHFISVDGDQVTPACPKCRRSYADSELTPLVLSCHHTFCDSCIQGMTQGGLVECHTCHDKTPVPLEGILALPHNYGLNDLSVEDINMLRRINEQDALDTMDSLCPVCFDPFGGTRTPMLLGCGHSVCDSCLKLMAKAAKSRSVIKCPECRVTTDLASSEVTANFALKATLDEILRLKSLPARSTAGRKATVVRTRSVPHTLGSAALRHMPNSDVQEPEVEDDDLLQVCESFHEDVAAGRVALDQSPLNSPSNAATSSNPQHQPRPKAKAAGAPGRGAAHRPGPVH
eukprot:EG_transcript_5170